MKKSFALLFFGCLAAVNAWAAPPSLWAGSSNQFFWAASAGVSWPAFKPLNNYLSTFRPGAAFVECRSVGIDLNCATGSRDSSDFSDAAFTFEILLHDVVATDSISFDMRGWHFMSSIWGIDVIPGKRWAFVLAPGVDWGSMKIKQEVKDGSAHFRNPFISPFARGELRFMRGMFVIGARAYYRYDITNSTWKQRGDTAPALPGTKFSGFGCQAFIGIGDPN